MTNTHRPLLGSVPRALALAAALLLLLTLAPLSVASAQVPDSYEGDIQIDRGDGLVPSARFAGNDRIETSGLIATDDTEFRADFEGDTAIIARSELEFDALAGSVLGGLEDAPIILSPPDTAADNGDLNPDTQAALEELEGLQQIFILGQEAAIGEDVEAALQTAFPDVDIERIGGVNRFETAALIADRVGDTDDVILARADLSVDALVAGSIAAAANVPILLTGSDGPVDPFAAERLEALDPDRILVAGGEQALADETVESAEGATTGAEAERVAGESRFGTAVRFAQLGTDEFNFGTDHVNLARDDVPFDALALGPHAALDVDGPAPIVLVSVDNVPNETEEYFTGEDRDDNEDFGEGINDCLFNSMHVAGGIAAVNEATELEARQLLSGASGEPCNIELTPESATNLVGESHTVTATVTDNAGDPAETGTVTFTTETGTAGGDTETETAQPQPDGATVEIDDNGEAEFTFTSRTPGRVTITASVTDSDGNTETATATKDFVVPDGAFALEGGGGPGGPLAGNPMLFGLFDEEDAEVVEGLNERTSLVAIDVRPSTGQLYGLGSDGELYKLDREDDGTVTATSVGNVNDEAGEEFNFEDGVGFDFNPTGPVALRITTAEGDSLRVTFDENGNLDTVVIDPDLFKNTGTETETAVATGAAYRNNPEIGSGEVATETELYAIDTEDDTLVEVDFMTGETTEVGELSGDIDGDVTEVNGFDIVVSPSGESVGFVVLTIDDEVGLYALDLDTGEATFITEAEAHDGLAFGAFVNDQDDNA